MTQNIPKYINQLLYNHECVIVSGLGAFIKFSQSTKIDDSKNYFSPNKSTISFNSEIKRNDGLLANYISEIDNISYAEACILVATFTKKILYKLNNGDHFHFEHIGVISKNSNNELIFEPQELLNFDPDYFGLDSFYFPKIEQKKYILQTQHLSGFAILLFFVSIGLLINDNIILNNSNNASFEPKINIITENNSSEEFSGLYSILVSQVDYDLYKINGTNYHLETKRCFKMGNDIESRLKIYSNVNSKKRSLCFMNELGLDYTDCFQIKNVYKKIPTSSNNLVVVDKKGRMRDAILVFEKTEINFDLLNNNNHNNQDEIVKDESKNDIVSRFSEAVKTLSQNSIDLTQEEGENRERDEEGEEEEEEREEETVEKEEEEKEEEEEEEEEEREEEEIIIEEKNVYVIVGCFSSEKNAKNLVIQLKKKGYNEACLVGKSSNRNLHRVACSKYKNLKEANKKLKNLKKEFQGAWLLSKN